MHFIDHSKDQLFSQTAHQNRTRITTTQTVSKAMIETTVYIKIIFQKKYKCLDYLILLSTTLTGRGIRNGGHSSRLYCVLMKHCSLVAGGQNYIQLKCCHKHFILCINRRFMNICIYTKNKRFINILLAFRCT